VEEHNAHAGLPDDHLRVVCYAGQHVVEQSAELDATRVPRAGSPPSSAANQGKPA
jgi:hypothetical protein